MAMCLRLALVFLCVVSCRVSVPTPCRLRFRTFGRCLTSFFSSPVSRFVLSSALGCPPRSLLSYLPRLLLFSLGLRAPLSSFAFTSSSPVSCVSSLFVGLPFCYSSLFPFHWVVFAASFRALSGLSSFLVPLASLLASSL